MNSQGWAPNLNFKLASTTLLLICALLAPAAPLWAADADAAQELAKQNNCFKCHQVEKKKDGPSYKEVAAKYRDKAKAESQERIVTHLTTGEMAKFPDGHEEKHKVVKAKDPAEVKNLVDWILSL
jgi:cytochrome c